jgi:hypothetical protein
MRTTRLRRWAKSIGLLNDLRMPGDEAGETSVRIARSGGDARAVNHRALALS